MPWDFAVISDVSGWTVSAVMGLVLVRMLMKGTLVPKSTHQEMRDERNTWRDAALTSLTASGKTADVLTDARQAMRASTALIQALPEVTTDEEDEH